MLAEYLLLVGLSYGFGLPSSHMHGPSFLEEPPASLEFTNSSGAILNCIGQGNPMPDVRWVDITDKEISEVPKLREKLKNGSLHFSPFSLNELRSEIHQTVYKCVLSNIIGSIVSRECKLRAEISNPIDVQVSNVVATKGNVAVMKCTLPMVTRTNQFLITWLKDDPSEGRSIITTGDKFTLTYSGELHVRDVNKQDSRVRFYCQLTCKLTGERYFSQPGHIAITEPESEQAPKIEYSTANVRAHVGEAVDLICSAQGYPPPTYRWFHNMSGLLQEIRSGGASFVRPRLSVLQFPRVQISDSSVYVCMVSNKIGEDSKEMKLSVFSPLIAFIRPQKLVVDSGSQAVFNCSVQGSTGDWSLYWLKNGNRVHDGPDVEILNNGEILVLKRIERKDSGMYQCFAQNYEETAQASAELILGAVAPEFEDTFVEETVQPGSLVSLRCIANGNPPPRIIWLLDGGPVQPIDGFFIGTFSDVKGSVVAHLNITSTKLEHGGLYTCIARNFLGSIEHSAMLNVYGPPTSRAPLNLTAVSGTNIYLRCPVSGYPVDSTTWFSNGEVIIDHNTRKVFTNGTLLLIRLEEEKDEGKFACKVYNQHGLAASGSIFLNIMAPPEIMPFHPSTNLKEGGKTNIACSVTSGDLPITFLWRKDGKPLPHDSDVHEHVFDMSSTLRINNLAAKHSGLYTCIATNPASSTNFTAKLIVKASPTWSIEPQDTTVLHRHSAIINCQANGFPVPRVLWTKSKENKPNDFVSLESNSRLLIHGNGSLEIKDAERQHEGFYSCQADNGIGTPIAKTVFLKVNIPAHFRTKSFNQSGIAGRAAVLSCEAEGDLPIRISWSSMSGSSAVYTKQTASSAISELHFDKLNRQHAGVHRCTASNAFGYDYMAIFLSIKEPPDPPRRIRVLETGSRWLRLNWTVENNDNTHFIIQYRPMHENNWYNFTIPASFEHYQIEALLPNTAYQIKVIAVNEIGRSKPSVDITTKTLQEVPNGFPMDITIDKVSADSVIVKWKVLSPELWNGELLGYRIYYSENSRSSNVRTKTVRNVDANKATLFNMRSYVTYEISLRAFNQIGEGPSSPPLTVTTSESTPTSPPQNVECTAASPESIRVQWRPPAQNWNGVLQGYKLSYQPSNPHPGERVYVEYKKTQNLETIIHGLEKYTNYSIRVLAYTNAGEGVAASYIQCTTMEDVPGAPDQVKALVMSSDSILVVWTAPKEPGGKITKYNIYMQSDSDSLRKETVLGESNKRFEFRRLTENHKYEFWITASTAIGEGQSSIKIARTLCSKIPPKISSFSRTVIGVAGTHVSLECNAVGLPTPTRLWKKFNHPIMSPDIKLLLDKSLWIPELESSDAGNYSCTAENVFGNDRITYELIMVSEPAPPSLQLVLTDKNSVALKWRDFSDGGCPILGYVINVLSSGEELQIQVDPDKSSHTVMNLKCGTRYQFDVQALNNVGSSNHSNVVSTKTKGDIPEVYNENELFFVNSTNAILFLDGWPERECPIEYFTVSYRLDNNWIYVGKGHLTPQPITISDLVPAALYTFRIGVFNEAGNIHQNFAMTTRSLNGEVVPIDLIEQSRMSIITQLNFIIPLVSGVICLISITVCVVILLRRKKLYDQYKSGETTITSSRVEMEAPPGIMHRAQPLPPKSVYSPAHTMRKSSAISSGKDGGINDYDVYPYATFTVPTELQTFRDCSEGNPMSVSDNMQSLQRRRRNSSKNLTDTMNLEIACISNQQTLPIGKKSAFGTLTTTSFNDPENNPNSRHKKYYMKRELYHGSSTESADMSPDSSRRPQTRCLPTSRDALTQSKNYHDLPKDCDHSDKSSSSSPEMLQHERFNLELTSIIDEYRKKKDRTNFSIVI